MRGDIQPTQGQIEHQKTWKTQKTGILNFFRVFRCSLQSEVKKITSVKTSLCKARFNPCKMRFTSHLSDFFDL